jgi:hypothetical protein
MTIRFTYVILRYVHDAGAGEMLNVGVVVYAPTLRRVELRVETKFERLSQTFKGFEGARYRRALLALRLAFREVQQQLEGAPLLSEQRFKAADDVLRSVWPDLGLSFVVSEPLAGVTRDFDIEVAALFDRMVTSLYEKKGDTARRTDDQVWRSVYQPTLPPDVSARLTEKSFVTNEVAYKFCHAFKNGAWNVVQPVSMDFVTSESIQRKATHWVGTAVGLEGVNELGTVYFLLGKPTGHAQAYERAKRLLSKAPVRKEIIEEHDAERFAVELTELVRTHSDE